MLDRAVHVLRLRWRSLTRRREVETQLADEIAYHLAEEADLREARGDAPAAAAAGRASATSAASSGPRRRAGTRAARCSSKASSRICATARGRCCASRPTPCPRVLTIALGIGATTAVFALVDGILVTRLPYPAPERLVTANAVYPGGGLAAARRTLSTMDVAAYADGQVFTLAGDGPAVRVTGARVSAELFGVLGVTPARGRIFRAGEDQAARDGVVLLSDALWRTRFGADPGVVGRSIVVDGRSREIVGVLPASVDLPSRRTQIWVPLALDPRDTARYWAGDFMPLVARLRPGVTAREGPGRAAAVPARRAPAVPVDHARRLEPRSRRRAVADRARRRCRLAARHPVGGGAGDPGDRLRQRRQPEPVAGRDARARDRHPDGDRRRAAPRRPAAPDRASAAGRHRRRRRVPARLAAPDGAHARAAAGDAAARRGGARVARAALQRRCSPSSPVRPSAWRPSRTRCACSCGPCWTPAAARAAAPRRAASGGCWPPARSPAPRCS